MKKAKWIQFQKENRHLTVPILSFPSISINKISVNELVHSSDYQAKGMKAIANRCPTSAAVNMMDLSVEAEAFGAEIKYRNDEIPAVISHPIKNLEDAQNLKVPVVGTHRTGIYIEAIKKAKKAINDRLVFAGVIGPFSLAANLMGMTEIMINCYVEPKIIEVTLEKTTEYIIDYIKAFKLAGANGIILAEPAAGLLSPEFNLEFSSKYVKRIVEAVESDDFIFVYHNCGNVVKLAPHIIEINADVYHFGNAIDIEDMLKIMPKDKLVMGNVDPAGIIRNGTPESIYEFVSNLLKRCNKYENFIISSGCDIPPDTSWDNIKAYFKAILDFYQK
jgi:uroporphyrinogen decarboxylase